MSSCFKILSLVIIAAVIVFNLQCKHPIAPQPPQGLRSNQGSVTLLKTTTVQVNLSGGTIPYSIKTKPDSATATATLTSATLSITGIDTGHTFIVVQDSKSPQPDSVKIQISVVLSLPVSFSNDIQPIFNAHCTNCHGGQGGLTLTSGASYNQLVHVLAQSSCTVMYRVLPYQAANSVLYRKVSGTSCGNTMPVGGSLTTAQINSLRDWINQGALR